jgi:hypothetical protein
MCNVAVAESDDTVRGFPILAVAGFIIFATASCINEVWYGVEYGAKMGDISLLLPTTAGCDWMARVSGVIKCLI